MANKETLEEYKEIVVGRPHPEYPDAEIVNPVIGLKRINDALNRVRIRKQSNLINKGKQQRVQVKTTGFKNENGTWRVELRTNGSNRGSFYHGKREDHHYDMLFVLNSENECWSIPSSKIEGNTSIIVGKKYNEFKI